MSVFKYHAFIYFMRPPPWYGTPYCWLFSITMFWWVCSLKSVKTNVFCVKFSSEYLYSWKCSGESAPMNLFPWLSQVEMVWWLCSAENALCECVQIKMFNVPVIVFCSNFSGDLTQDNSRLCFSCECVLVKCSIDWLIEHFRVNTYFEVNVFMCACLRRCFQAS